MKAADLHVIAVVSNPVRYQSRIALAKKFTAEMKAAGVTLWQVEATFGERPCEWLEDLLSPHCIHVHCNDEIWLKENLIDVALARLPRDAKYVMWCDADITFQNPGWASETIQALQHYDVVQLFSSIIDYGPTGEVLATYKGFFYCYLQGLKLGCWRQPYGGPYWHPGYACAWRLSTLDRMGGMIDRAIVGAGDYHMACALIGQGDFSIPGGVHPNYRQMVKLWEARANAIVQKNVGYVPGTITHGYHDAKDNRGYESRWEIVYRNQFDPYGDLDYDRHGVLRLSTHKTKLRDDLRRYFRSRDEDEGFRPLQW